MKPVTFEDFCNEFAGASLSQLAQMVEKETGQVLRAKSKAKALEEAYELYCASLSAQESPAAGELDAAAFETPKDLSPAPPDADAERTKARVRDLPAPAPAPPAPAAPPPGPVVYEGRSRTGRPFHKMGHVFLPRWEPIGQLSDDEIAHLRKWSTFVQIRIRG